MLITIINVEGNFGDDTGLGKNGELLLAAFLHTLVTDELKDDVVVYRSISLFVLPSLFTDFIAEIHQPVFHVVTSDENHNHKDLISSSLSLTNIIEFP